MNDINDSINKDREQTTMIETRLIMNKHERCKHGMIRDYCSECSERRDVVVEKYKVVIEDDDERRIITRYRKRVVYV